MINFTIKGNEYVFPCCPGKESVYRTNPKWMFADIAKYAFSTYELTDSDFPLDITVDSVTSTVELLRLPVFKEVGNARRNADRESMCFRSGL